MYDIIAFHWQAALLLHLPFCLCWIDYVKLSRQSSIDDFIVKVWFNIPGLVRQCTVLNLEQFQCFNHYSACVLWKTSSVHTMINLSQPLWWMCWMSSRVMLPKTLAFLMYCIKGPIEDGSGRRWLKMRWD